MGVGGQCFNALTTHFNFAGYDGPHVPGPPDAVVHFAAYGEYTHGMYKTTLADIAKQGI